MLKYKLNIKDKHNALINIKYESLYLSQDCTFITGVTDPSYGLSNEQTITVVSDESIVCNLSAHNALRCGYVIYNKEYAVQKFDNSVGVLYIDGQYYCVSKDYSKKLIESESIETISDTNSQLINPFIKIENKEYEIGEWVDNEGEKIIQWYDKIVIPTIYWAYDGKIHIDDAIYDVIIDEKNQLKNDDNYFPYIILNDLNKKDIERILYIIDWEYSKRKEVTLFTITAIDDVMLHIQEKYCVDRLEYFLSTSGGNITKIYAQDCENRIEFLDKCLSEQGEIFYEWKRVDKSNVIDLYVEENINGLNYNNFIEVKPVNNFGNKLLTQQYSSDMGDTLVTFEYYGVEYKCDISDKGEKEKYLNINGIEYHIQDKNATIAPYIIFQLTPISIVFEDENKLRARLENSDIYFDVKYYPIVNINGKKYKVDKNEVNGNFYYSISNIILPSFQLQIIERFGNNVLRCKPLNNEDLSVFFHSMINDNSNYYYTLKNTIFNKSLIAPISQEDKEYFNEEIHFLINHNSFVIPISLEKKNALNLHQTFIAHQNFAQKIKEESINRIVDMEKDIYYPAYYEKRGNEDIMTLCHEIKIDLHFRTRDLTNWVINENVAEYVDSNGIENDSGKNLTNWNIFDYYRYAIDKSSVKKFKPLLKLEGVQQFYPPSDLLYFLNFTNEDVFYQKQKIGKSFLRLSFYDSPNPQNQNLLYTTTIFMSETSLFQKYINVEKTIDKYVTIKERGYNREKLINEKEGIQTTYHLDNLNMVSQIGVDTEPCKTNYELTFDEGKRLSSSFVIKNRNEATESSEGFYIYLFKEFANGLHERSIYMRVQFNHAGFGKTVNFMQMFNKHSNGEKSMINWSTKFNFDKHKDGYPLNELYEHLYIEIKVKYDVKNHRFCYFLPKWMCEKNDNKHIMRLSLFEVKIKDESEYKL